VNIKGKYGSTLLHWACENINNLPLDVFKFLIETMGCDVNVQDDDKNTPLHKALENFDPYDDEHSEDDGIRIFTVLTYLLSQMKVNADIKGKDGYSLLHTACEKINKFPLDVFQVLIEKHGCDVNVQNDSNDTPLHRALDCFNSYYDGDINVLVYLIDQKIVNANSKTPKGDTLLHLACRFINALPLDVFKVLIEKHGCDVNVWDNDNYTPLHRAIHRFDPGWGGDVNVLVYLINQTNIGVNTKYTDDFTLLHSACTINLSNTRYSMKLNAECDAISCQIVEAIAERCIQQVLDEAT
jgi:ankyrin repeat protein